MVSSKLKNVENVCVLVSSVRPSGRPAKDNRHQTTYYWNERDPTIGNNPSDYATNSSMLGYRKNYEINISSSISNLKLRNKKIAVHIEACV